MVAVPQFPPEILQHIISTTWQMPLGSTDRIVFMRASALVNSTWADIFDLVSTRDVYVPSAAFCDHFIGQLRMQQPSAPAAPPSSPLSRLFRALTKPSKTCSVKRRSPNLSCTSITFQLANVDVHPDRHNRVRLPMAAALDELLENIDARSLTPNLRVFTIEYLNAGFDDVLARSTLDALPEQVTDLCVRYAFSPEMPPMLLRALQQQQERKRKVAWRSHTLRDVTIVGAGQYAASDMSRACPSARIVCL
ncbi:hypothetical protein B0H15DRAFT_180876 [Mycena belliarum]|uniref:Uncharacterized protein n=1 Tax=Mycena belliarum TaxID=1033014 RepID=A0AAD6U6Y6_9AGAR|nr:hypothetical protein B0H15DRAFT_180876 [Mycena belliae]